jgi:quinol monooxygenase YgiN
MQSTRKVSLTAEINILPGFEKEVLAAAESAWIETRKEPDCEMILFNTKKDAPNVIVFFEVFKSQAGFDTHIGLARSITFAAFLKGKVVGDGPTLTFLNQYKD